MKFDEERVLDAFDIMNNVELEPGRLGYFEDDLQELQFDVENNVPCSIGEYKRVEGNKIVVSYDTDILSVETKCNLFYPVTRKEMQSVNK